MAFRFAKVHGVPFQNASRQLRTSGHWGQCLHGASMVGSSLAYLTIEDIEVNMLSLFLKWQLFHWGFMNNYVCLPASACTWKTWSALPKRSICRCFYHSHCCTWKHHLQPPSTVQGSVTSADGSTVSASCSYHWGGCMWDGSKFKQDTTKLFGYVFPFPELSHQLLRAWPQPMYMNVQIWKDKRKRVALTGLHGVDPAKQSRWKYRPHVSTRLSSMKSKRAMVQLSSGPVPPRTLWSPVPAEEIPRGSDSDYRAPFSRSSKSHAGLCSFQQNQKQHKTTNKISSSTGLFRGTHFPRLLLAKHMYTQLIEKRTKHSNSKFAADGQLDA